MHGFEEMLRDLRKRAQYGEVNVTEEEFNHLKLLAGDTTIMGYEFDNVKVRLSKKYRNATRDIKFEVKG